ncbi:hypothetical protein [uncultured Desulfovibrio sp.]|uniref:hypothetical protein n=1 Tax=uncultured Desulfovibrio sp. TaxID=167968 RepID=UPI002617B223|nr:hypothetical protein [uncultured Desulfovibrio sp.]
MNDAANPTGKDDGPVTAPSPSGAGPSGASAVTAGSEPGAPGQEAAASVATGAAEGGSRHGDTVAEAMAAAEAAERAGDARRPDRCERVFRALAHAGPLFLLLVLAAQVWPDFWHAARGDALYCPAEARNIEAFFLSMAQSAWLTPGADGVAHWPFFTWFLGMLAPLPVMLTGSTDLLFPLAGALGAALALLATWGLARTAGFGSSAALAAGLLLLAAPLFAPLGHFTGPAALAAALMVFSLVCFCRGWQAERAWCALPAGFALAGLAGLAGGPFHLALPLVASVCFLVWRGGFRRAQALDALLGFLLLLLLLGAWLAAIMLGEDDGGYLHQLFAGAAQKPWPLPPLWWLAAALATAGLVPWILAVFGVSWVRVLREAPRSLAASRRAGGAALVWISLALGLLFTPCIPAAEAQMTAVALACVAAPLLGKAILALPRLGGHLLYACAALLLLGAGLLLLGASFELTQGALARMLPVIPDAQILAALRGMPGLPLLGGLCLLAAVVMARFVRGEHGGGGLVAASVMAVLLTQPATLLLAPQLGTVPAAGLQTLAAVQKAAQARLAPRQAPGEHEGAPAVPPAPETGAAPEAGGMTAPAMPEPVVPVAPSTPDPADTPAQAAPPAAPATPDAGAAPDAAPQASPEAAPRTVPETGTAPEVPPSPEAEKGDAAPGPGRALPPAASGAEDVTRL